MARKPALTGRTVPVAGLDNTTRHAMYALFADTYDDVEESTFHADLADKDHVIMLHDEVGAVQGFSTLKRLTFERDGARVHGVFSGDTVIAPGHWGGSALGRAFLAYLFRTKLRHPTQPLWWFLISKGYKTYLLMANNFHEHWPRYERHTPREAQRVMDTFGKGCFGDAYDNGLVRLGPGHGRLREAVAPIDVELAASNPRIAYFQHRNPGWVQGDELLCVARMTWTMPLRYRRKKRGVR